MTSARPRTVQTTACGFLALATAVWSSAHAGDCGVRSVHETCRATPDASAHLERDTTVRSGDLSECARRGWPVRVLVPYSRTFFWVDEEGPQGFVPGLLGGLEEHLHRFLPGCGALHVTYVVTPLDEMQSALAEGRGEIAAGAVVETPAWNRVANMSTPILDNFDLCVAAGPGSRPVERLEDLSDRCVVVVRGRAADDMMQTLAPQFAARGLTPPRVEYADDQLSMEDVLEMVGTGGYEYTVLPRPLAASWARTIPGLVATGVSVSTGQRAALAVRKDMPELDRALDAYLASIRAPERAVALLNAAPPTRSPPIYAARGGPVDARLQELAPLFAEYGAKYGLNPVLVAAQCFQESRFDPKARSRSGAMGLMQLMPATAEELGVRNPFDPRESVEGGCKYMDWLHRTYFSDSAMTREDQHYFCLAAYNAGAGNVRKWRALAAQRGLDANRWFGSVERVARANGVLETVTYVSQIAKYAAQFKGRLGG